MSKKVVFIDEDNPINQCRLRATVSNVALILHSMYNMIYVHMYASKRIRKEKILTFFKRTFVFAHHRITKIINLSFSGLGRLTANANLNGRTSNR